MQNIFAEKVNFKFKELIFPLLFFFALLDFIDLPLMTSVSGITSKINLGDIGTIFCLGCYLFLYKNDIIDEIKIHRRTILIGAFFLLVCLIPGLAGNPLWIVFMKYWIKIYLFFFIIIIVFMTGKFSPLTINIFCVIFIALNILGIIEFCYFESPGLYNLFTLFRSKDLMLRKHGMASVFSNQNIYGIMNSLFFVTILLIKKNYKKLLNDYLMIISLVLSLTGVFLSLSLNAILTLSLGCALIIFKLFKKKEAIKWLGVFIISIFMILVLSVKLNNEFRLKYGQIISSVEGVFSNNENSSLPDSFKGRLRIWDTGMELFMEKPIFGWGTGMTFYKLPERIGNRHLHNCYLDILVNNGLAGFVLFIWLLSIWLYSIRRSFVLPLILSLLFSCLFDTFIGSISWLVFTAWITAASTNGKSIFNAECDRDN